MKIEGVLTQFLKAETFKDEQKLITELIEYITNKGISNFQLNFWNHITFEKQESFVRAIFIHLIQLPSEEKTELLKILRNLYLNVPEKIQEKILMIFYASLFEEKNFKLSIAALDFFTQMFQYYREEQQQDIFSKLLDFIQESEPYTADEGIRSILSIKDELSDHQILKFYEILIRLSNRKNKRLKYVSLETLGQLVKDHKNLLLKQKRVISLELLAQTMKKNNREKDIKINLSLLRFLMTFSQHFNEEIEEYIMKKLKQSIKKMQEQYNKQILPLLEQFWKSMLHTSQTDYLELVVPFIVDLYKKKNQLSPIVYQLLEHYLQLIWDYLPTETKNNFY